MSFLDLLALLPILILVLGGTAILMAGAWYREPRPLIAGGIAIALSASICSVTRMVPISAAMAAPTRPATMSPVSTGPSSRPMAIPTTPPIEDSTPNSVNLK